MARYRIPAYGYRQPSYPPPPPPPPPAYGYRQPSYPPPPEKPFHLGPFEKKVLLYGVLAIVLGIVVFLILRLVVNSASGYSHSISGSHCKKNNHCGSGKKHRCNCGSGSGNSGHNSCGGS